MVAAGLTVMVRVVSPVLHAYDAQLAPPSRVAEPPAQTDAGPVMVGMTLQSKMVYDVWGPTVTTAHHLARSGHPGQILVSEATRSLLPDTIETNAAPDAESTWVVSAPTVGGRT